MKTIQILTIIFNQTDCYLPVDRIISIVADDKDSAITKLNEITGQDCDILFIDCIDDTTYRDTIVTIGATMFNAFSYWNTLYN